METKTIKFILDLEKNENKTTKAKYLAAKKLPQKIDPCRTPILKLKKSSSCFFKCCLYLYEL